MQMANRRRNKRPDATSRRRRPQLLITRWSATTVNEQKRDNGWQFGSKGGMWHRLANRRYWIDAEGDFFFVRESKQHFEKGIKKKKKISRLPFFYGSITLYSCVSRCREGQHTRGRRSGWRGINLRLRFFLCRLFSPVSIPIKVHDVVSWLVSIACFYRHYSIFFSLFLSDSPLRFRLCFTGSDTQSCKK